MNVNINNSVVATGAADLLQLATELKLPETGVAMALNNQMVPRTSWAATPLSENDRIVIIKAACGG